MTFRTRHPGYPTRSKEQPGLRTVNLQRRAGCSNDFMQSHPIQIMWLVLDGLMETHR